MIEPIRLGVAGLGTVGSAVIKLLSKREQRICGALPRPLQLVAVTARDRNKDRGLDLTGIAWSEDPVALAERADVDVFVELVGGKGAPAYDAVKVALGSGKSVVTANKALLAHHGTELARLAEEMGAALRFEAAVAGGIPIIKALRESLWSSEIRRVYGILNGTCNYILSLMMTDGRGFDDVLAEAQAAGYAEADPSFDIGGFDAAHKLALLASISFGSEVAFDDIYIEGIEGITLADMEAADELGYRIKLLGVALKTEAGIEQRVHPTMVPKQSPIAEVYGVTNCVAVDGDCVGSLMLVGPGAGAGPTASSVMSDIMDVARGDRTPAFVIPASRLGPRERARMRAHEGAYYIRMSVYDRPGAFAAIANRMAEQAVSLESIVQRRPQHALPGMNGGGDSGLLKSVVLITHSTTEAAIRRALDGIVGDGHVGLKPQMIRIEDL